MSVIFNSKTIRIFAVVAILFTGIVNVRAQRQLEGHLKADIVSSYIWRGQNLGQVSLQPELAASWRGLNLSVWGSMGLTNKDDNREIDLKLWYETGGLSFGIVDYWDDENDSRFFYYKKDGTGHVFEGFIGYDFGPVDISWQTIFAGNDYQSGNGKRSYSSYFELSVPFRLITCDWNADVGLVPWRSDYYDVSGFNVTNLSLRATKAIKITKSFELPLFTKIVANPVSQKLYFLVGLTLKAL